LPVGPLTLSPGEDFSKLENNLLKVNPKQLKGVDRERNRETGESIDIGLNIK